MGPCPPTRLLEAFAAGASADEAVAAHIGGCAACRAAVDESRENNRFLAGVRTALAAHAAIHATPEEGTAPVGPDLASGYQIQEEIHRGGQGVVYRAIQTRTHRVVAIKMLPGGRGVTGRQRERFEREIRIAAGLRHPNIVTVHDSGFIADGRYGLVMEYIEGVPLDRWSRSLDRARGREARRAALRERLGVMVKVCDAVLCAHQHSIVHRDLKPANILVDAAGEPHILDFGIARDVGPEQHTRLTHTGEFAGTLAYASPEQVSGDPTRVDTRTDIYSLGVIMYELVSGKMPYPVDGPMSRTLRSIESAEPVPLPRITRDPEGPWVDGEVSTIVLKAMAKDPARRYQTAAALRDDLGRYLAGEAIEARRDSTWYVLRKTAARHRVVVAAAALIMVMLAVFGGAMAWEAHRLDIRGRELADALSASNVERGRSLAAAGDIPLAEDTVWPELIRAGVTRINGPEAGFSGSPEALHAYWGLWDIFQKSSCVAMLRELDKPIGLLYFDEDGRRLSALDATGRLVSWSAATWEPVRDKRLIAPVDGAELRVALTPGGNVAYFGGKLIRVINPETGKVEASADDPEEHAVTGAFSPDGALLASIGRDNRLRIWDARALTIKILVEEQTVCGADVFQCWPSFSLDGTLVAAEAPGGSVGLWNAATGALVRTLSPPDVLAKAARSGGALWTRVVFAPDGTIAASLGYNVAVWPADGSAPANLGFIGGPVANLAFLPGSQGRSLAASGETAAGAGGITVVWNLVTRARTATIRHPDGGTAYAAGPEARFLAVGASDGLVQVYEPAPDAHVRELKAVRGSIIALSPDGRTLAMSGTPAEGAAERQTLLVDLRSGTTIGQLHRETPLIRSLAFAPDGLSLFEGETDGRITQWDLAAGSPMREFRAPDPPGRAGPEPDPTYVTGGQNLMRISPDGSVLARARNDGLIGLWDVPSGRWIDWLDSGTPGTIVLDFTPDGRTLAAQLTDKCILWDLRTRRPGRTIPCEHSFPAVRCSPAGPIIARGAAGRIQFFDTDSGRLLSENHVPLTAAMAMIFHPGGSVLFASAWDSSIRLWDTRTGAELLALQKHTGIIRTLLLTPDGNTLISSDVSGRVLVWDLTYYSDRIRRELVYRAAHGADRPGDR